MTNLVVNSELLFSMLLLAEHERITCHGIGLRELDFDVLEMLEYGFVVVLDHVGQHVDVLEYRQPKFRHAFGVFCEH